MGYDKDWIEELDNIRHLFITEGVIGECSMHQGSTFMITDESHAYAVATNALSGGQVSVSRGVLMDAVKSILDDTPSNCVGCSG